MFINNYTLLLITLLSNLNGLKASPLPKHNGDSLVPLTSMDEETTIYHNSQIYKLVPVNHHSNQEVDKTSPPSPSPSPSSSPASSSSSSPSLLSGLEEIWSVISNTFQSSEPIINKRDLVSQAPYLNRDQEDEEVELMWDEDDLLEKTNEDDDDAQSKSENRDEEVDDDEEDIEDDSDELYPIRRHVADVLGRGLPKDDLMVQKRDSVWPMRFTRHIKRGVKCTSSS